MGNARVEPWSWLLRRTRDGSWRHVPYRASELGPGQDPTTEPRVEVIRRLIAYPEPAFAAVVAAVAAAETPERPARWLCYRAPGDAPARPYWLCFVSGRPNELRRFHLGLELYDRARLGLWFFSGYAPQAAPPELLRPFPARPDLELPRLELTAAGPGPVPLAAWIEAAWRDRLAFPRSADSVATPPRSQADGSADQSRVLDASLAALEQGDSYDQLALRASRARLVVEGESAVELHPIATLSTTIGRDPRCAIVLDDRRVSNEHARIAWHDGTPRLEDLDSKNGTRVDAARLLPEQIGRPLGREAALDLGGVRCLFVRDPEPGEDSDPDARLGSLVARGVVDEETLTEARAGAEERGITPLEVLLAQRKVTIAQWTGQPAGGGGGGCISLVLLLPGAGLALRWLLA